MQEPKIMVSIICKDYNHEEYVRKALSCKKQPLLTRYAYMTTLLQTILRTIIREYEKL